MDIMEKILTERYLTEYPGYYLEEVTVPERERVGLAKDLWLGKFGSEKKIYLGHPRMRVDIESAIRRLEACWGGQKR